MVDRRCRGAHRMARALFAVLFAVVLAVASYAIDAPAALSEKGRVLFISSYSLDADNMVLQNEGIKSQLGDSVNMSYMFMNAQEINDKEGIKHFYELLEHYVKVQGTYDVVIVGDDDAATLVAAHKKALFGDTPMVFMGIELSDNINFTRGDDHTVAVTEERPFAENVELIRQLLPKTKMIVLVSDSTKFGNELRSQFYELNSKYPKLAFNDINTSDLDREKLAEQVSALPKDAVLLFAAFSEDGEGNFYNVPSAVSFISQYAQVPVFKIGPVGVGSGAIGGVSASVEDIGQKAGAITKQMLSGVSPNDILETSGEKKYYFDCAVLDKYGISRSKLPVGAVLINEEEPFFTRYSSEVTMLLIIMVCGVLVLLLIYRTWNLGKYNRLARELENSNRQLTSANDAKSDFLSRVSHDMRTPMNAIIGFSNRDITENATEKQKDDYLAKINVSGRYLLGLINDVLDMSKIESGKMTLLALPEEMAAFFVAIDTVISPLARKKGVNFELELHGVTVDYILADRMRMEQVFVNLLSNGVKFTEPGGEVRFDIYQLKIEGGRVYMRFKVSDTGIGISDSFLPHVFEPFEQENDSVQSGTGLGLAIAKNIVEKMGGTIFVESAKGVGTVFTVTASFEICPRPQGRNRNSAWSTIVPAPHDDMSGHRILLCEDHRLNAEIVTQMLGMMSYSVDVAFNGQEGVSKFASSTPHYYSAIIMDLRMPVMDGYTAAKGIRSMVRADAKSIPIIAVTANAFEQDVQRCFEAGMNAHVPKPVDSKQLSETLKRLIK